MSIYGKLGFTPEEVESMLDHILNDTADIYDQAKKDRDAEKSYKEKVDQAIELLGEIINSEVPKRYQRFKEIEVEKIELVLDPDKEPYYALAPVVSDPLNPKLVDALDALKRIPEVNYHHEGKNFPTKGKDRLTRTYYFLKKRYETKTGRRATITNTQIRSERRGDFGDLLRQVSSDINQPWIRSLVGHAARQIGKAQKNKT